MIRKGTWIVLLIFVLLLGVAFYLSKNPLPTSASLTPTATEIPPLLSGWKSSDIVRIDYIGDPGPLSLSQNPDGSWTVGPENPVPATIAQVEYVRSQLTAIRMNFVLNTTDPMEAVGLAAPTRRLILQNAQGAQVEIRIGKETPTGSGYYIQVDNQTPVVINKFSLDGVLNVLIREQLAAPTPTPELLPDTDLTPTVRVTETPQK